MLCLHKTCSKQILAKVFGNHSTINAINHFGLGNFNASRHLNKPLAIRVLICAIFAILCAPLQAFEQQGSRQESTVLTRVKAIELAQKRDLWLQKSELIEQRFTTLSEGAKALPDPTLSLSLLNLPTNGFALDQEPMTQIRVGLSQMFPRGDTLELEQSKHLISASEQPLLRQDRMAKVVLNTTQLWLDAYLAQASYKIIEEARPLIIKLSEIVSAGYASSVGSATQQDIIRAELELMKLNDRLLSLAAQKAEALDKLKQFLHPTHYSSSTKYAVNEASAVNLGLLPNYQSNVLELNESLTSRLLSAELPFLLEMTEQHPLVLALDKKIALLHVDTNIAKQSYAPQWGANASYAYRDDEPNSQSRADFFSVGLSVSVPLWSSKRNDSEVSASIKQTQAMVTQKRLLMRELIAGLQASFSRIKGLKARKAIYIEHIIPQMSAQAQATLNTYTNAFSSRSGDFAEVVRARVAELDAKLVLLEISIKEQSAIAQLHYYLTNSSSFGYSSSTAGLTSSNSTFAGSTVGGHRLSDQNTIDLETSLTKGAHND